MPVLYGIKPSVALLHNARILSPSFTDGQLEATQISFISTCARYRVLLYSLLAGMLLASSKLYPFIRWPWQVLRAHTLWLRFGIGQFCPIPIKVSSIPKMLLYLGLYDSIEALPIVRNSCYYMIH